MKLPAAEKRTVTRWQWVALAIIVLVGVFLWIVVPLGTSTQVPTAQPQPRSTDWATEPEGPAVPVTLPKTPMTNSPEQAP